MGTKQGEVADALLALWTPMSGLAVVDGPSITGERPPVLFVGYDGDPNSDFEGVTTDREPVSMDSVFTERVVVRNGLLVWNGDAKPAALRAQALPLFDALVDLVDADPTLGLDGVTAHIPGSRYFPRPSESQGLEGLLQFDVIAEVL